MTDNPFHFHTQFHITEFTGQRIRTVFDLLELIKISSPSILYYHTYQSLKKNWQFMREPSYDFAYWATHAMKDEYLGKELSAIDLLHFSSIEELRDRLILVVEDSIKRSKSLYAASKEQELLIKKSKSIIIPTHHVARDLKEFADCLHKVSIHSIYFHMFEAHLRHTKIMNDFSLWIEHSLGEYDCAHRIAQIDPYLQSLEDLRFRISAIIDGYLQPKEDIVSYAAQTL